MEDSKEELNRAIARLEMLLENPDLDAESKSIIQKTLLNLVDIGSQWENPDLIK